MSVDDLPDEPDPIQPPRDPEEARLKFLWANVLHRAILDARGHTGYIDGSAGQGEGSAPFLHNQAQSWFDSHANHVGSFRWVCNVLGVDPSWVRRRARV